MSFYNGVFIGFAGLEDFQAVMSMTWGVSGSLMYFAVMTGGLGMLIDPSESLPDEMKGFLSVYLLYPFLSVACLPYWFKNWLTGSWYELDVDSLEVQEL